MIFTTVNGTPFQVSDEDADLVRAHLTGKCAWRAYLTSGGNWRIIRSMTAEEKVAAGHPKRAGVISLHCVIAARMGLDLTHPHNEVDHINRDTLDNQRVNLRAATHSQNQANKDKSVTFSGISPTSKFAGVTFYRSSGRWMAQAGLEGKNHHLGYFDTEVEAAQAYDHFVNLYRGEFAHLNFP